MKVINQEAEGESATKGKTGPLLFALVLTGFIAYAFIDSMLVPVFNDKVFPVAISGVALVAALALLLQMAMAPSAQHALFADGEISSDDAGSPYGLWGTLAWFLSLLVLTALVGFVIALVLFFLTFLLIRARTSVMRAVVLTVCGVGFIVAMAGTLNRDFPPGLLQAQTELPWPLR
ncbi:MAG: tricarboxylate transporter, partial [Pseudomonadota bacterium]